MTDIGRLLVYAGVGLVLVGAVILLFDRFSGLPLGRLPGDFSWERGNVKVYVPIATMVIVSIVLTLLVNLLLRIFK